MCRLKQPASLDISLTLVLRRWSVCRFEHSASLDTAATLVLQRCSMSRLKQPTSADTSVTPVPPRWSVCRRVRPVRTDTCATLVPSRLSMRRPEQPASPPPGQVPSSKACFFSKPTDKDRPNQLDLVVKTGWFGHENFWAQPLQKSSIFRARIILGSCPRTLRSTGGVTRPEELLATYNGKLL